MSPFLPDHRSARQPEGRCRKVSGAVCWRAAQEGRCWEDNYGGRHPPISTSLWLPGSLLPRLSAHLTKLPDAGRLFPTLCYSPPGRRHCPAPPHSLVSLPFSTWLAQRNSVRSSSWWFLYQSSITSSNSSTSTSHCGVQHQGLAKRRHPTLSRTPGYTMTHGEIGRQV